MVTSEYIDAYRTDVYLFKDIDYIQLDDFSAADLTVKEGDKVNGYTVLTKDQKVVNQGYLNTQITTIDQIMTDKYNANWPAVVSELGENYVGMAKINSQFSGDARDRKSFLINSTRYMGETTAELDGEKAQYAALNDGAAREISLSALGMSSTGYIYASVNSMEKVISESVLPYISEDFLGIASRVESQNQTALKVINNDHAFAAFVVPKDKEVAGEEAALKLKKANIGTTGSEKNAEYYKYLVKRVDKVWEYPTITLMKDNNKYRGYLVDEVESGDNKIVIVLIKDYVNVFAEENIVNTDINIQDYDAFEVPRSAIEEKDDGAYITMMERGYFEEEIKVNVARYDDGKAIMPVDDNPDLYVGMSYKVYP